MTRAALSRRLLPPGLAFVFAVLSSIAPLPCAAHAVVVESSPAQGATLRAAPQRVVLRFNVRIEHALARATLRSGHRDPVALAPLDEGPAQSDRLTLQLPALAAGEHEVRYRVLATDGHTTQGVLRFRVTP